MPKFDNCFCRLPNRFEDGSDDVTTVEKGQGHQQKVEGVSQFLTGQDQTEDHVAWDVKGKLFFTILQEYFCNKKTLDIYILGVYFMDL